MVSLPFLAPGRSAGEHLTPYTAQTQFSHRKYREYIGFSGLPGAVAYLLLRSGWLCPKL